MIFTLGILIFSKLKISRLPTGNILSNINLLQMFYQPRQPSANKWAALCSFKVDAIYQKLITQYPGPRGFLLFLLGKFCDANRFFYGHEALLGASISASRRRFSNNKRQLKKKSLWDKG